MTLLNVQAAQERILSHFHPVETETQPLTTCAGRVLAADILSSDLPPFDNSSVDGFAVIASDLIGASISSPRALKVTADIAAGAVVDVTLGHGEAIRIMTGAAIPKGADAVIMVEDTDFNSRNVGSAPPSIIRVSKAVQVGENLRKRGMDVKAGHKVLFAGQRLRAQDIGLLAMLGVANVSVYRKPRVALLSSGDELIPVEMPSLAPGKTRDSNSYVLSALVNESGCEAMALGIAPDKQDAIQFMLDQAVGVSSDLIISSAGVSVGAFDFIKTVVEMHGKLDFWKVNIRPGKPLAFGEYRKVPFFGLPGNPVSAFIGFEVFVRPALSKLCGMKVAERHKVKVRLSEPIESDGRESYLRARVQEQDGILSASLTGHQGSGNLLSLVQANALLIIPAGVKSLPIDAQVDAWMF